MNGRRTQTATEYLVLLAIIIIILSFIAPLFLPLFSASSQADYISSQRYWQSANIGITSFAYNGTHAALTLVNNFADSIQVINVTIANTTNNLTSATFYRGERKTYLLNLSSSLNLGNYFSYSIVIAYRNIKTNSTSYYYGTVPIIGNVAAFNSSMFGSPIVPENITYNGTYQYLRWNLTAKKGDDGYNAVQIVEFEIFSNGVKQNFTNATAINYGSSSPGGQEPPKLVDNNQTTKVVDLNFISKGNISVFEINMGHTFAFDSYRYVTGEDFELRDPTSWILEGSRDNITWDLLDLRRNVSITYHRSNASQTFAIYDHTNISPFEVLEYGVNSNETMLRLRNNAYYNLTINQIRSGCFNYRINASVVAGSIYSLPLLEMLNYSLNGLWINYTLDGVSRNVSTENTSFSCPNLYSGLVFFAPGDGYANEISSTNSAVVSMNASYGSNNFSSSNRAFTFDTTQKIEYQNVSALNPTGGFTISLWWKPYNALGTWTSILYKGVPDSSRQYSLFFNNGQFMHPSLDSGNVNSGAGSISYNQWNHVGVTYNYSTTALDLYVNGVKTSGTVPSSILSGGNLLIADQIGSFSRANGSIDDIMIFNRKLSDSEIAQLRDLKAYKNYYRYLRWNITGKRAADGYIQANEFEVLLNDVKQNYTNPDATNPGGSNNLYDAAQGPLKLVDGSLASSKWVDSSFGGSPTGFTQLRIDMGRYLNFNQYRYNTGDDFPDRDPVSWTLWGSTDSYTWVLLDNVSNATITTSRNTYTQTFNATG